MSDSPRAGPSQHRTHPAHFIAQNGWENHPLLSAESSIPQYSSGMRIPLTPSHSPSTDAPTFVFAGDPVDLSTTTEIFEWSANQHHRERLSRSRLWDLYNKYNPRMVFENRGSTARDHLASERTFLAYVRTSLALASAGVALVQLFTSSTKTPDGEESRTVPKFARQLGMSTVVMALIMLGIAVRRYFLIQNALPRNMFPVARFSIFFITFVLSALVIVIFAALLAGR